MENAFKHWELGLQYARVALNWTLTLNTAAIIAAIGLKSEINDPLLHNILWFVGGISSSLFTYTFAYFTQLHYGNEALKNETIEKEKELLWAHKFHTAAYVTFFSSVVMTVIGIVSTAMQLLK